MCNSVLCRFSSYLLGISWSGRIIHYLISIANLVGSTSPLLQLPHLSSMPPQIPIKLRLSIRVRVKSSRDLASLAEKTLPQIILTHQLATRLPTRKQLLNWCTLHFFRVGGFDRHVSDGSRSGGA